MNEMTDTVLRNTGMRILKDTLGIMEAERFITLINREPFDYTEWRQDLCRGMTVQEISHLAMQEYIKAADKTLP
jgi:hypothetical protein